MLLMAWPVWSRIILGVRRCALWPSSKRGFWIVPSHPSHATALPIGAVANWPLNWAMCPSLSCSASGVSTACARIGWTPTWSRMSWTVKPRRPEVIGLYLQPPEHAIVFCVDGKTTIQALDRKDRQLPLSPGRAQSHGFEYKRNGTLSLFAALNTATGEVVGKTAQRHTSAQFVRFLEDIVADHDEDQQIHVICDNVSSHKTALVQTWLLLTPNVHIHDTPTYSASSATGPHQTRNRRHRPAALALHRPRP